MKTIEMNCESLDGHTVFGTYRSTDHPIALVLLIHGITANRDEWGYYSSLGNRLVQERIASLAIDYRGHGASKFERSRLSLAGIMLDMDASWSWMVSQQPQNEKINGLIVGNSFGGGVSYLYGMRKPEIRNILLTAPVLSYVDDLSRVNPAWKSEVENGTVMYASSALSSQIIPEMYYFDSEIRAQSLAKQFQILHGEADSDVPIAESRHFCTSRNGVVNGLPGMDHCWAAPGDPKRETSLSKDNQSKAVDITIEVIRRMVAV